MKMTIIGVSASPEGAISKAGKGYRIGQIHTTAPLGAAFAEGGIEKGHAGTSYSCDPEVVRRIAHLSFPLVAEVEVGAVMRFGKREETVLDVKPVELLKKAA
jgi:hypothetical protein